MHQLKSLAASQARTAIATNAPDKRSSILSVLGCIVKPTRSPDLAEVLRWLVSFLGLRFINNKTGFFFNMADHLLSANVGDVT